MPCYDFGNPELDLAIGVFLGTIDETLRGTLRSVILYGSVALGDLAPGYGDLDFVAITDNDIADDRREALIEARRPLRSGPYGVYARMIEGAFLPRHMTCPGSAGKAVWWGTSGERLWESNWLGWFDCLGIRERGVVIHGEDLRCEFPTPARDRVAGHAGRADTRRLLRTGGRALEDGGLRSSGYAQAGCLSDTYAKPIGLLGWRPASARPSPSKCDRRCLL